jgi:threonyl-tRNA synthetase
MSTIQLDFNQPARFGLEYQAADGTRQQPVMIHRALFGSIERFFGVLTEHYAGAFPAWLAPVQAVGIPIRSENIDYLRGVVERLRGEGVRAEVDESDDRMQKKILHAQQQKVPFMLVAGERDVEAGAVSIRYRNGIERRGVPVDDAIQEISRNITTRQIEPDALNPETSVDTDNS